MALVSLQEISLSYGGPRLFDELSLQLEPGERVALLGRNGAGKTTLMKVMAGQVKVNSGEIVYQKGIRVTHLPQEVPVDLQGNVFDIVLSGLGDRVKLLSDYHHVNHRLQTEYSEQLMRQLGNLQAEMDRTNGWETTRQVEDVIAEMKLDSESLFENLSGGQKRRALLARALVQKPEVLLLDEPTNHLDIESIDWLEGFLKNYSGTIFFVTHDRMFMQHLATRIMELDRGRMFSWSCDYATFLERKQAALENEAAERARFEKRLAQEEVWIRQGIKARRTRNEGRVRALERMRDEKREQRQAMGKVRMQAQEADRSGQIVSKAENLGFAYGDKVLIRDFSTRIMRGDKIGVIGPNGCGKTTLLRILLGHLEPQKGTVTTGTNLKVAYYDQLREQLDENKTVAENVSEGSESVTINGNTKHIMAYLQDFLFAPERARTKVKVLSGGERNRLFLARLFTRPANLLVMDEPTNDLDIETLELLEELLVEYSGTLLIVSHDRAFLNNVVTSTIVLEGGGEIGEYAGGYDDCLNQQAAKRSMKPAFTAPVERAPSQSVKVQETVKKGKLSFKEKREKEALPGKIEKGESDQAKLFSQMAEPSFYQKEPMEIAETKRQLEILSAELSKMYERWEYLESLES